MKLTKGKISKLYNKKKQSLKKKKLNSKNNSRKNKTFRRKRAMNLANRSLKNLHYKKRGGKPENAKATKNNSTTHPKVENKSTDKTTIKNVDHIPLYHMSTKLLFFILKIRLVILPRIVGTTNIINILKIISSSLFSIVFYIFYFG